MAKADNPMQALAVRGVRKLRPYQPGKPIAELEREYGVRAAIKLASNENPLGPGQLARDAIKAAVKDLARYPDGNGFALKAALSNKLGVDPAYLTLGNGSNDLLEIIARTFIRTVDEVIFSAHAFAVYPIVTQAIGARAVVTPAKDYGHDLVAMAAAITARTRVIFIANPNNPTGTWVDKKSLAAFLARVPSQVIVVIDEAYCEYIQNKKYPDALTFLQKYSNVIVTRTFSKVHGLAGLRVGYAVSSPDIADLLNRVRQPFNVNAVALAAAEAALFDDEHLRRSIEVNNNGMKQLTSAFEEWGIDFIPSLGNFITFKTRKAADEVYDALLQQGVIVRPVGNYGLTDYLRVSIGLERENRRFLAALDKVQHD